MPANSALNSTSNNTDLPDQTQILVQFIKHHQQFDFLYQASFERLMGGLFGLKPDLNCILIDQALFFDAAAILRKTLSLELDANININTNRIYYLNFLNESFDEKLSNQLEASGSIDFLTSNILNRNKAHLELIHQRHQRHHQNNKSNKNNENNQNDKSNLIKSIFNKISDATKKLKDNANIIKSLKQDLISYMNDDDNHHIKANLVIKNLNYLFCNVENSNQQLNQLKKYLAPEALIMLSHFGPQTAIALRNFLIKNNTDNNTDADANILNQLLFSQLKTMDMHDLGDLMAQHFSNPVVHSQILKIEYQNPAALLNDLPLLCMIDGEKITENHKQLIENYWQQQPWLEIELVTAHAWHMQQRYIDESGKHVSIIQFKK